MRGLNDTCSAPSGPLLAVSRLDIAIDGRGVTVGTHFFFLKILSKTTTPSPSREHEDTWFVKVLIGGSILY